MKILIACAEDPQNVRSWSGTPYHMSQALANHYEVAYVQDLHPPSAWHQDWLRRWYWYTGRGWYMEEYEPVILDEYARRIREAVRREKPDAFIAVRPEPVARLKLDIPVYFVHDATFRQLLNYYATFTNLCQRTLRAGEQMQQGALSNSTGAFYSSTWAATSAIRDYHTPADKVHVVPLGANIGDPPAKEEVLPLIDERLKSSEIHFIFVGVDWKRKGGEQALKIIRKLVAKGLNVRLDIVGCAPPAGAVLDPFITCHGFLSKLNPDEAAKFRRLLARAHFFILPSEAECTPCAFNEANAFGVPIITRDTGGITEIVRDGVNGFVLSAQRPEEALVETVFALCRDPESYRNLALQALNEYATRLNWNTFSERIKQVVG